MVTLVCQDGTFLMPKKYPREVAGQCLAGFNLKARGYDPPGGRTQGNARISAASLTSSPFLARDRGEPTADDHSATLSISILDWGAWGDDALAGYAGLTLAGRRSRSWEGAVREV